MWYVVVSQSCLTLCEPVDYTVHGILQARILEWGAIPFSRGCSVLQGIFETQDLLHCMWILYQLSYQGNPNEAKVDVFWSSLAFSMIQLRLAI